MNPQTPHKPALITFPPSLDSELARFLLAHYGIEYDEQPHAFLFSIFPTLWHGRRSPHISISIVHLIFACGRRPRMRNNK